MSTSLLHKSLKLFESDGKCERETVKGAGRNIDKYSKKRKKLIVLSEKKEEILKKNLENNLKALKNNQRPLPAKLSKKVKALVVNRPKEEEKPKEETSVFTEEDFQKFEAEYAFDD